MAINATARSNTAMLSEVMMNDFKTPAEAISPLDAQSLDISKIAKLHREWHVFNAKMANTTEAHLSKETTKGIDKNISITEMFPRMVRAIDSAVNIDSASWSNGSTGE